VEEVSAMILAGGQGKRMGIFCRNRAKPGLPFAGNTRVIDFTLSNCIYSQLSEIAILIDYQRSNIATYLKSWSLTNGNSANINVFEPRDGSYRGTADAVYQNIEYLENHGDDLMVLAGDHIYKMDYRKMLAFHRQMRADATVAVVPVPIEQANRFGIVTTDGNERIVDFEEKPELPQGNLVSMGIYVFNKQVLIERLIEDAEIPNSPHDFGHAILPGMVNRDNVFAYKFDGYWRDIGNPQAYYEANMELILSKPSFSLDGTLPVLSASEHLPQPRKSQQASIENSLVSPGCVIKGRVENSILSPGVWVEEKAEVRNSIVMANCFIGYHSVVDCCILDEGVNVGKFCYLGFEGEMAVSGGTDIPWTGRLTVLGEGATVPPLTAICHNCKILPNVGPADFAGKVVPPNSVISPRHVTDQLQTNVKEMLVSVS
jgi:glucose-1-phosphate adenylyltransferase